MSRRVKALVERRNASDVTQWIREAKLINATVRLEGSRTVNTMECDLTATDVQEQDHLKYIQDDVDTTFLTAIYNFQGNDRDEAGWDHDGDNIHTLYVDPSEIVDTISNTFRFKSQYGVVFDGTATAGNEEITVTHDTKFNFNKQFDLYCWVQHHSSSGIEGDVNVFFSKIDRANANTNSGIELGAKKVSGLWTVYARIRNAGVETEIIGNNSDIAVSSRPRLLHLWRDENDKVYLRINQMKDGTAAQGTTISGDLSCTNDVLIGAGRNTSNAVANRWRGAGWQLRVYTGSYLNADDTHLLHEQMPTPTTMKFLGRIWKIEDKTTMKHCKVKSVGKLLLQTVFNKTLLNTTHTGENANRTDNDPIFDSGQSNLDILQSLVTRADSEYVYYVNPSSSQTITGEYVGEGAFEQNADLLLLQSQDTFTTLARKVFIVENDTGVSTDIVFNNGGARGERIIEDGKDDTNTVNDLEIIGRSRPKHDTDGLGAVNASGGDVDKFTTNPPLNLRVIEHAGTFDGSGTILTEDTDYTVNYDKMKITFINGYNSGANNVTAEYDYEFADSTSNDSLYIRDSDSASITENGRYGKRLYVTQFTEKQNDLTRLATRILTRNASINQRIAVHVPTLYNAIRENYIVEINNTTKGITAQNKQIKQIIYKYPEGTTTIQVGEVFFDSLEWQKFERSGITSSISSTTKNKIG